MTRPTLDAFESHAAYLAAWESWYCEERMEEHEETLRTHPVECRIAGIEARIPMDNPKGLAAWIKGNRLPKARKPRKVRLDAKRWPNLVAFEREMRVAA